MNEVERPGWSWPPISSLVLATGAGLAATGLLLLSILFGGNIPQPNISTDYAVGVVWAFVLSLLVLLWPVPFRERLAILGLWVIRSGVTLFFMLPYEGRYPDLDGYGYFSAARRTGFHFSEFGLGQGTENIVQLSALQNLFLPDSYHALKVSFSFVGLLAVWFLYRSLVLLRGSPDLRILYLVGLFPSILFWSSIFGKEPVVLLGTALYGFGVVGWFRSSRIAWLLIAGLGILLAAFIRIWNAPILLIPFLILLVAKARGWARKLALLAVGGAATAIVVLQMAESLQMESLEDVLSTAESWSQAWAVGGSAQRLDIDFNDPIAVIAFIPAGIFAALFRPLPGEVMNPFGLLSGLENALLLAILLAALLRARFRDLRHPLALWAVTLVLMWSAVYAIVSYQNLGTAVRFKVQILPVLLAVLLYLARPRWLRSSAAGQAVQEVG